MSADDASPGRQELINALTSISGKAQLLQRRILRADGLAAPEREAMLGTLADLLTVIHDLAAKIHASREPGAN